MRQGKITIDDVRRISEKYSVDIEMSFGSKRRAIITNGSEIEMFKTSFDNIDYETIKSIAKDMKKKDDVRREMIKEQLSRMDAGTLPENLFDKTLEKMQNKAKI